MPPRTKAKALNFEQATARLEEIVARENVLREEISKIIAEIEVDA